MRKMMLAGVAAMGLSAQVSDEPKPFIKTLDPKQARRMVEMGERRQWLTGPVRVDLSEQEQRCAVPLLNVTPPGTKDKMMLPARKGDSRMPQVKVPAPACKEWKAE